VSDLFSAQADAYKKYRPVYPQVLYDYILSFVPVREAALDVATGNGQAAVVLADYFKNVVGIDSSAAQLTNAVQRENIEYRQAAAEQTFSKPHAFDLITVAQAYHWLQHEAFAKEAARIAKPDALIAVWMYDRFKTSNTALDSLMDHFYRNIVGPYWDAARTHIDNHYDDLPFPYKPLPPRTFFIETKWNSQQLLGYLSSWSAVQTYINKNGSSPLALIANDVNNLLGDLDIAVRFPLFLRLGHIHAL